MAYLDAYLEVCPGFGWQGGPTFSTTIVPLSNGHESRNANWSQAKHKYQAPFLNIDKEAYRQLKKMHLVCRGMLHAFRFRDELDYQADSEPTGAGDGVQTIFPLIKTSEADGFFYVRRVYAPLEISVRIDGVLQVEGVDYEVDYDRGTITFAVAPILTSAIYWSGTFDVWVRFDSDEMPFSLDNPGRTNGMISVVETAPPPLVT